MEHTDYYTALSDWDLKYTCIKIDIMTINYEFYPLPCKTWDSQVFCPQVLIVKFCICVIGKYQMPVIINLMKKYVVTIFIYVNVIIVHRSL